VPSDQQEVHFLMLDEPSEVIEDGLKLVEPREGLPYPSCVPVARMDDAHLPLSISVASARRDRGRCSWPPRLLALPRRGTGSGAGVTSGSRVAQRSSSRVAGGRPVAATPS